MWPLHEVHLLAFSPHLALPKWPSRSSSVFVLPDFEDFSILKHGQKHHLILQNKKCQALFKKKCLHNETVIVGNGLKFHTELRRVVDFLFHGGITAVAYLGSFRVVTSLPLIKILPLIKCSRLWRKRMCQAKIFWTRFENLVAKMMEN